MPGVLEALLTRIRSDGWSVGGARRWASVRKLRAGGGYAPGVSNEERNVRALILDAVESGCDVLAFSRDRDRDEQRENDINKAIADAHGIAVIGGVAVECLDSWCLALLRERRTEDLPSGGAKTTLEKRGPDRKAGIAESADLSAIPEDAKSLRAWLDAARRVLGT